MKPTDTSDNSLSPKLTSIQAAKIAVEFERSFFKQEKNIIKYRNVVNFFIDCELNTYLRDLNTRFTLDDCLFWAAKLTENAGPDNYRYTGWGIGFDTCSHFSLLNGEWGKNLAHNDNGKNIS